MARLRGLDQRPAGRAPRGRRRRGVPRRFGGGARGKHRRSRAEHLDEARGRVGEGRPPGGAPGDHREGAEHRGGGGEGSEGGERATALRAGGLEGEARGEFVVAAVLRVLRPGWRGTPTPLRRSPRSSAFPIAASWSAWPPGRSRPSGTLSPGGGGSPRAP